MRERLSGGGLKGTCNREKWNTSVLECLTMRPNFERRFETTL